MLGCIIVMSVGVKYQSDIKDYFANTVQAVNVKKTIVEVQKIEVLEERIKEAQDAAREEIETMAESAYNAVYNDKMREVSDSIKEEYIAEIEATITSEDY